MTKDEVVRIRMAQCLEEQEALLLYMLDRTRAQRDLIGTAALTWGHVGDAQHTVNALLEEAARAEYTQDCSEVVTKAWTLAKAVKAMETRR